MLVSIGSDHKGFVTKMLVIDLLKSLGHQYVDTGCGASDISVDYSDYADSVCRMVLDQQATHGILICHTGIGMSIAANRFGGIRAALCTNEYMAKMSRMHNDANVIVLCGYSDFQPNILATFFDTEFEGGKHLERVLKLK